MPFLPQLLALGTSFCYAACFVVSRRGLQYSNPVAVTLLSLAIQVVAVGPIAFWVEGLPAVPTVAVILFAIVGILMAIVRLFSFTGVAKVGAARASSLRSTAPLASVAIAIVVLGEPATPGVLIGTALVVLGIMLISWQTNATNPDARWWHATIPLAAAGLAGVVHPIRRYALTLSNFPFWFATWVGLVALLALLACLPLLAPSQKPRLRSAGILPVAVAGLFQTTGFLLANIALGVGPVVHVIPIIAAFPVWVLLGSVVLLRDVEKVNLRTITGTCLTVSGTIAILLG